MTSVFGSVASIDVTWVSAAASTADPPLAYFTIVFPVQAASSAVNGVPSVHLPPGFRWNVQVFPSVDVSQLVAQSPMIVRSGPYWTSCG